MTKNTIDKAELIKSFEEIILNAQQALVNLKTGDHYSSLGMAYCIKVDSQQLAYKHQIYSDEVGGMI